MHTYKLISPSKDEPQNLEYPFSDRTSLGSFAFLPCVEDFLKTDGSSGQAGSTLHQLSERSNTFTKSQMSVVRARFLRY